MKSKKISTLPNLLSVIRLLLIPVIVYLYCAKDNYLATAVVLFISALTDVVDGFIARRFDMISDLGKILDPVADKLTQFAMMLCLLSRFPLMWAPLILLVIKELLVSVTGIAAIKYTGEVLSAVWHGKLTTVVLYLMMTVHLLWYDIPPYASAILIGMCVALMLFSFAMYCISNISRIISQKN